MIEKYTPKLLGKKLSFFSLSLEIVNLMFLIRKQCPRLFETEKQNVCVVVVVEQEVGVRGAF